MTIEVTKDDIGRAVEYTDPYRDKAHERKQQGIITSFNESYVFVRYGSGDTSQATKRKDLNWYN